MQVKGVYPGTDRNVRPEDSEWIIWEEICRYTGWNPEGPLKPIKYNRHIMPHNPRFHVGVQWYKELTELINKIHALRIAIVGPAGKGKTYMGIHIANVLERERYSDSQTVTTEELDLDYLNQLGLADRVPVWQAASKEISQVGAEI